MRLSHNINSGTFYTLTLGQFRRASESHQPGKWWDPSTKKFVEGDPKVWDPLEKTFDENAWDPEKSFEWNQKEGRIRNPLQQAYNDTTYFVAGDNNSWGSSNSTTSILRADFASQVTANHQIQTGVEFLGYDLYNLGATNYGSSNLYMEYYEVQPYSISAYVQDKMEYEGMIVNAGLRYDLYNPDGNFPEDPFDPLELNDDGTRKLDKSTYKVGLPIIKDPVEASTKHMIAPRLGISFPSY